jgi:hypothetical protein
MDNCHIEANGEYAILSDAGVAVGNITIKNCLISGQTFLGANPASGNQFSVPNVPRQLVAFQSVNLPITFKDNSIQGVTGGLTTLGAMSFNSAVTIDAPNSLVTGNTINGTHGYGYALRVRGAGSTASNNVNYAIAPKSNSGFLIGPTGSQVGGLTVGSNASVTKLMVTSIQDGADLPINVSIEKNDIKALSKVAAHPSLSIESNWKLVTCVFKHTGSSKRIVASFRNFSAAKDILLKPGMSSSQSYQLFKIIVSDADRNLVVVSRSEISGASSFDFTLK